MTFPKRIACLLTMTILVGLQSSCRRQVSLGPAQEPSCLRSSEQAYEDYRNQRFAQAIEHADKACNEPDWQLIFSSYTALFLQHPSEKIKKDAEAKFSRFEHNPSWFADPGPLLIVLGEDDKAKKWYVDSLRRLGGRSTRMKKQEMISQRTYFEAAIGMIDEPDWRSLRVQEQLQRVIEAEKMAVKKAREAQ
ncbi:hypothetical protein [Lysobacter terrae]